MAARGAWVNCGTCAAVITCGTCRTCGTYRLPPEPAEGRAEKIPGSRGARSSGALRDVLLEGDVCEGPPCDPRVHVHPEHSGQLFHRSGERGRACSGVLDLLHGFLRRRFGRGLTDILAPRQAEAAGEIIKRAREGGGPALLECKMIRFFGHFEGDPQRYRGPGEVARLRETRDCITKFRNTAREKKLIDLPELDAIDAEVMALIESAVTQARTAPKPSPEQVLEDVYGTY